MRASLMRTSSCNWASFCRSRSFSACMRRTYSRIAASLCAGIMGRRDGVQDRAMTRSESAGYDREITQLESVVVKD